MGGSWLWVEAMGFHARRDILGSEIFGHWAVPFYWLIPLVAGLSYLAFKRGKTAQGIGRLTGVILLPVGAYLLSWWMHLTYSWDYFVLDPVPAWASLAVFTLQTAVCAVLLICARPALAQRGWVGALAVVMIISAAGIRPALGGITAIGEWHGWNLANRLDKQSQGVVSLLQLGYVEYPHATDVTPIDGYQYNYEFKFSTRDPFQSVFSHFYTNAVAAGREVRQGPGRFDNTWGLYIADRAAGCCLLIRLDRNRQDYTVEIKQRDLDRWLESWDVQFEWMDPVEPDGEEPPAD
ncbi:hypothetical protein JW859_08750 [bacterium]|nr:hypothetical protein [bacterium]